MEIRLEQGKKRVSFGIGCLGNCIYGYPRVQIDSQVGAFELKNDETDQLKLCQGHLTQYNVTSSDCYNTSRTLLSVDFGQGIVLWMVTQEYLQLTELKGTCQADTLPYKYRYPMADTPPYKYGQSICSGLNGYAASLCIMRAVHLGCFVGLYNIPPRLLTFIAFD